jgi:hypothetical protein
MLFPVRATIKNNQMKFFLSVVFFVTIIAAVIIVSEPSEGRWYDCRLAEFHPDYPIEVKEACRKAARDQLKNKSNVLVI